jgi:hypothetical protein
MLPFALSTISNCGTLNHCLFFLLMIRLDMCDFLVKELQTNWIECVNDRDYKIWKGEGNMLRC